MPADPTSREGLTQVERDAVRSWVWEQACGEWTDHIVDSDTKSLIALIEKIISARAALSRAALRALASPAEMDREGGDV